MTTFPKSAEEYGVDYSKPIQKINTEDVQQLLDNTAELKELKAKLAGGVRMYASLVWGSWFASEVPLENSEFNSTLIIDQPEEK